MPLSEHEQRILEEIERNLVSEDPKFARGRTPRFDPSRRTKLGGLLFVVGIGILLIFFATQEILVGVLAFGAMVTGIVLVLGSTTSLMNARSSGKDKEAQRVPKVRIKGVLADLQERIRKRYKDR